MRQPVISLDFLDLPSCDGYCELPFRTIAFRFETRPTSLLLVFRFRKVLRGSTRFSTVRSKTRRPTSNNDAANGDEPDMNVAS